MRGRVAAACVGVGAALAWPAGSRAELRPAERGAAAPYADQVRWPRYAGGVAWHQVGGAVTPGEKVLEFVPDGETELEWSQIITIKTLAVTRDPAGVVQGTLGLMREVCGKISVVTTPHSQQFGDVSGPGVSLPVLDVTDMIVTCQEPDLPALRRKFGTGDVALRRYEVTWYRMMKGEHANYIVQRGWHGDEIGADSVLGSHAVLDEWKKWLTQVTVVRQVARRK